MSHPARESIYEAISSIRLIDPHTHINPHQPASSTLADLLGYHYYTELAHSAGMPKAEIEEDDLHPRELVRRMVCHLGPIDNTAQYRWLVEICRKFFGFEHDRIDESNWEQAYDLAENQMQLAEWPQMVLDQSNVEAVFLTNDFDDELSGYDTSTYIPCLRTDELVFHLAKPQTRARLEACTGIELDGSLMSLRESLRQRFEYFSANGGRACAISLPPSFQPSVVNDGRTATALEHVLRKGVMAEPQHQLALSRRVFWTLAELCDEYSMPFDLMIGVNRGVYSDGVFQGQDLYDSRVSLIQYAELFNAFPNVKFPISVLASVTNQELVSYAWIFPNVITNGHWWYSNTPSFIARDAAARLEAVPRTKQIAYYSDAYKLEFVWPKFDMYRQILAGILADHFVGSCGWSEERAIELGQQVLRGNVDEVFRTPFDDASEGIEPTDDVDETADQHDTWENEAAAAGASAALAAGAIGIVEVSDSDESALDADEQTVEEQVVEEQVVAGRQASLEDTDDGFSTVYEDPVETLTEAAPPDVEDIQGFMEEEENRGVGEVLDDEPDDDLDAASDHLTVNELEDTVQMETVDAEEDDEGVADDVAGEFDPLPTEDEIQAVGLDDVELTDDGAEPPLIDANTIEEAADPTPIDAGEMLGESDPSDMPTDLNDSGIRMLRGEESFSPDEDSLQLQPDPLTGELTFPVPSSDDDSGDDDLVALSDDSQQEFESEIESSDVDLAEAFVEAAEDSGIAETVDLEHEPYSTATGDSGIEETFDLDDEPISAAADMAGTAETIELEVDPNVRDVGRASDLEGLEIAETIDWQGDVIDDDDGNRSVLDDLGNEESTAVADRRDDSDYDEHNVLDDLDNENVVERVTGPNVGEVNDLGLDDFEFEDEATIAESPTAGDESEDDESVL